AKRQPVLASLRATGGIRSIPTNTCTDSIVRSARIVAPSTASRTSSTAAVVAVRRSLPSVPPAKRRATRLLARHVTAQEHDVCGDEGGADVEGAYSEWPGQR